MSFPKDFIWGAASASYQIEGGAFEDGKGPSIWDRFSHTPGKVTGGHTGDIAADAYHRFEEDLNLMQQLGIRHYRFSISWPRVFPDGTISGSSQNTPESGAANPEGLNPSGIAYYDKIVNGCLSRGITPWITLYHWDLPQALQEKGGWLNRETAYHFGDYASFIASHFRGRVRHYITINEPQCAIGLGLGFGTHAPGLTLSAEDLFRAWHHLLLAHGLAAQEIRKAAPDTTIGVASTGALSYLTEETCAKLVQTECGQTASVLTKSGYLKNTPTALSNAAFLSMPADQNPGYFFNHQWFLDPVFLGHYPDDPHNPWAAFASSVSKEDLAVISSPIDFAGLNIYNGHEFIPAPSGSGAFASGPADSASSASAPHCFGLSDSGPSASGLPDSGCHISDQPLIAASKYPGYPRTALKWPVTPEVLYWGPRLIYERYSKPVCITENGQSCNDRIFLDGKVHDPDRIDFLHRYLRELKKAAGDGVPVKAYFHWAFTDNFEWNSGYDERFGLVYIDYRDQRRIPKDSAAWYAGVIKENGETL